MHTHSKHIHLSLERQTNIRIMANKVVMSVASAIIVIGVVVGICLVLANTNKSHDDSHDHKVSSNSKTAETICKQTEYQDTCLDAVDEVAKNSSATPQDYIIAVIRATADELNKSLEKATAAKKDCSNHTQAQLETCEKMIGYATDELKQVLKVIAETKATTLAQQADPLLDWLTAVRSYQTTCVDEIQDKKMKADMQEALQTSNELTYNAQKIVYNVHNVLKDAGVSLDAFKLPPIGNRKLLAELDEIDRNGFPSWVPRNDRKLLQATPDNEALFKTRTPPPVPANPTPDAVVAQDGSGKFNSIKQAVAAYAPGPSGRYIIYIKAGTYNEGQITVDRGQNNVFMYGDGKDKTIITGSLNYGIMNIGTSQTATVIAIGERFMARGITFRNSIGPAGHQAVAFRSQSPHTVMVDCGFEGYQDTLYYHTHDQFYKNCAIYGTVDFIFGTGRAYIQDSDIIVRKPDASQGNMCTADGRMKMEEAGGVVLHNCRIQAAPELAPVQASFPSYLGRPWKPSATSVILKCDIGNLIKPEGWMTWESPEGANNHLTCMFREYGNTGPGSNQAGRVTWAGYKPITNERDALDYTLGSFLNGGSWLPQYGVPANLGL
ncbi:putative pectinesterase [Helianthus annuus]|nr:putative pectinesterase [Helianthus annuus]